MNDRTYTRIMGSEWENTIKGREWRKSISEKIKVKEKVWKGLSRGNSLSGNYEIKRINGQY